MAYLVVIGSVVVFLLYLVVLRHWAASRASYGFVIIPFVYRRALSLARQ